MIVAPAIYFFDVVVAVHVMCVVLAFGVTFAYPIALPWLKANHPPAMPTVHRTQLRIGRRLITPFMVLTLLTGIYLASDRHLWSQTWVTVPLIIIVVIFGFGGAFFTPRERKLAELADRDLGPERTGALGAEYEKLFGSVMKVGALNGGLILIAIFFMVARPFAG
ncbi:MAG TPA: DUF2269 family protein [Solirubrobacteraceae bacterium]